MSSCQGAPFPHNDCRHGDRCDWTPPDLPPDVLAELRGMTGDGISLVERGREWLRARKTRTPERALAEIEKLETADTTELGVPVYVWPAHRGRVTGHAVGCEEHGAMPFLAPTKGKAILAAARHVKYEHDSAGTVLLVESAPNVKITGAA